MATRAAVSKHKRYVVRVKREYLKALPDNPLDQTSDGIFESRDRAEDWCQALNWCAGYDRFTVEELSPSDRGRPQAA
jgi:hypothetical protein